MDLEVGSYNNLKFKFERQRMIKKTASAMDKTKKSGRSESHGFGRDLRNMLVAPKRTTAKREKSKISLCPQAKMALNPEIKEDQLSVVQYLKTKALPNFGEIKNSSITNPMRVLMVGWLIEVAHKLKMKSQTLFHGVYLLDQMLATQKISLENFQLLTISCLFVSSKYEQVYPPRAQLYSEVTAYTYSKNKIIEMEASILANCKFELTFSTRFTFLTHLCNLKEKRLFNLVLYLLELSLFALWEDTTENQIAEAAYFLASKVLKKSCQGSKKTSQLAWKLMKLWKQHYGGIVSYIFDCDEYSFVGGLYIETL